ncbi:hypothetical protein, partial [Streptomyces atratus]|uniref:hypothetical protein n=1 Tax=Streptomyces atratus TaxID=1893 RepID=UPI0033CCEA14
PKVVEDTIVELVLDLSDRHDVHAVTQGDRAPGPFRSTAGGGRRWESNRTPIGIDCRPTAAPHAGTPDRTVRRDQTAGAG